MNGRACETRQTDEEIIYPQQEIVTSKVTVSRPEMRSRNQKGEYCVRYQSRSQNICGSLISLEHNVLSKVKQKPQLRYLITAESLESETLH